MSMTSTCKDGVFVNEYELDKGDEVLYVLKNPVFVKGELAKPLSLRLSGKEDIQKALGKLKSLLGSDAFNAHIETIPSLKFNGEALLIIVKDGLHRSRLVRDYLPALESAFGTNHIRVVLEGVI